jgi:hypothetical protein
VVERKSQPVGEIPTQVCHVVLGKKEPPSEKKVHTHNKRDKSRRLERSCWGERIGPHRATSVVLQGLFSFYFILAVSNNNNGPGKRREKTHASLSLSGWPAQRIK